MAGKGPGGAPPVGKKERAAMAILTECGAVTDARGRQEVLHVTWTILQRMRQGGQTPPVLDPKVVTEVTPIRLLFMCSPKEQGDVIKALLAGFTIAQATLNPILTFDILHTSGTLLHPEAMRAGLLVGLMRAAHQMALERGDAARHFWEPRREALTELTGLYTGNAESEAVRAHDPTTGSTALHYAVLLESEEIVRTCFLHPRADDAACDVHGVTPLLLSLERLKDPALLTAPHPAIRIANMLVGQSRSMVTSERQSMNPMLAVTSALASCGLKYRERMAYALLGRHLAEGTAVPVGRESSAVGYCIEADEPGLLKELMVSRVPGLSLGAPDAAGYTPLHTAGLLGRYECARVLIAEDAGLCNAQDRSGNTPLFYLVTILPPGHTLDLLRNHQAAWDFAVKNNRYESVLDYYLVKATEATHSPGIQDVLHSLVSAGGEHEVAPVGNLRRDPKLFQSMSVATGKKLGGSDEPTRNLRDLVVDLDDLHELFRAIADRSRASIDGMSGGRTAAMLCAAHGLEEELHYLMSMGEMNVNLQDPDGRTALHHAALAGHADCFHVLTMAPDVSLGLADRHGNSALFYAAERLPPHDVQRLVKQLPWNFAAANYAGRTAAEHYLSSVPRPHPGVAAALRRACAPSPPADPEPAAPAAGVMRSARGHSQRASNPIPTPPPKPAPPTSAPPGSPPDPDLLLRRPTVGQLANQLEGMIRRPKRSSADAALLARSPPRENSAYYRASLPGEPGIRAREERSSTSRVQRFSYLESGPEVVSPGSPPAYSPDLLHRGNSFKSLGSQPPPYDSSPMSSRSPPRSSRSPPHPPLSRR